MNKQQVLILCTGNSARSQEKEKLQAFRQVRDALETRLQAWLQSE